MLPDLLECSALELATLIRRREVSCHELTTMLLDRISDLNPQYNAFVTLLNGRALKAATAADAAATRGGDLPLLHGVPTGIKDLVPTRGIRTTLGSRAYRYLISPIDAPTAKRMKRGGLVVLGKLATSEFGAMPITEPDIHPPTRNPWNSDHTAGGSSGGSGAAVAAGMLPLAQGSDGGGSIRIPAAFCHLFGFKPSVMLLGNLHGATNKLGLSTMGPLAHTVEDAAAFLDVLSARPNGDDATSSLLSRCRRSPPPRRIGICTEPPFGETAPEIGEAVVRAGRALEQLGHHVEPVSMVRVDLEQFLPLWQLQLAAVPVWSDKSLQPVTRWLREEGRKLHLADVRQQQRQLSELITGMFDDIDLLLTPTVPILPPRIGLVEGMDPRRAFEAIADIGAFTAGFNVTGQPAASLPAGVSEGQLPYAVQLVGRVDHDAEVLQVAKQLEAAMPWRNRRAGPR